MHRHAFSHSLLPAVFIFSCGLFSIAFRCTNKDLVLKRQIIADLFSTISAIYVCRSPLPMRADSPAFPQLATTLRGQRFTENDHVIIK